LCIRAVKAVPCAHLPRSDHRCSRFRIQNEPACHFFLYLPSSSLSSSTAAIHHLYLGWHPPLPPRPPRNPRTLCSGRARLSAQSSPSQGGRRPKEEGGEGEDLRAPLAGAGGSALAAARGDEKEGVAEPDGGIFAGSFPAVRPAVVVQEFFSTIPMASTQQQGYDSGLGRHPGRRGGACLGPRPHTHRYGGGNFCCGIGRVNLTFGLALPPFVQQ
jgi:hypothetical protein